MTTGRTRNVLWTLHRWIGVCLVILLVPIAVSGALLVAGPQVDALIHPLRYAVSGSAMLAPSAYLESATKVLESGVSPVMVRLPESGPVTVIARGARAVGGSR